jgi:hypothetical protein
LLFCPRNKTPWRKRYEIWRGVYSYCFGHYFPSIKSWLAGSFLNFPVVAFNSYYSRRVVVDTPFLSQVAIEAVFIVEETGASGIP